MGAFGRWLRTRWDQAAALGSGLFLLAYCVANAGAGLDTRAEEARLINARLFESLRNAKPVFKDDWSTRETPSPDYSPMTPSPWTCFRFPGFDPRSRDGGNHHAPPVVRAVALEAPRSEIGTIALAWKDDPATNVAVAGYLVERSERGGPWARLAEVPAGTRAYADAAVSPRRPYAYRVTERFKDAKYPDVAMAPPIEAVSVTAKSDVAVRLKSSPPEHDPNSIGVVLVRKFFKGRWLERTFRPKVGDPIGEVVYLTVDGARMPVDFSAGQAVAYETVQGLMIETQMETKFNNLGQPIGNHPVTHASLDRAEKLIYRDLDGDVQEAWRD